MAIKLGYKSVDDVGTEKKIIGKRGINRMRLINFFGKKEDDNHGDMKPISGDSHSTCDSTADLSPIKGEENDLYDDKFDLYFASAYLPHIPVSERDHIDRLVESPSLHCQAFEEAGEMEVPPAPPQKARIRKESSCKQSPLSKVESQSTLLPTNLMNTFTNNASIERQSKAMDNAKQKVISFGNDLVDAVEHSHSDFNLMLKRMSSEMKYFNPKCQFTELTEKNSPVHAPQKTRVANKPDSSSTKKNKVPKTMNEIKSYLYEFTAGPSTATGPEKSHEEDEPSKNYQNLFKTKMDSIAKSLSAVDCEANFCSIMEIADDIISPTLPQSGYQSSSPLDKSWFTVEDDSDSVSKLSMPWHNSELSTCAMSTTSEYDRNLYSVESFPTRTTIINYEM